MKRTSKLNSELSLALFISLFFVLVTYLLQVYVGLNSSPILFWIPVILIPLMMLIQILNVWNVHLPAGIILFEILMTKLVFCLIIVLPVSVGLRGYDSHPAYFATKTIMEYGWPIPQDISVTYVTRPFFMWPLLWLLAASLSMITGVDLFNIARSLPTIYTSFSSILLYLFVKEVYKNEKVALLSSGAFSFLFENNYWCTLFVKEGLAIPLMFLALYSYTKTLKTKNRSCCVLFTVFSLSVVLTHSVATTALMLMLLISFMAKFIGSTVLYDRLRKEISKLPFGRLQMIIAFAIITAAYWTFVGREPLDFMAFAIKNIGVIKIGEMYAYSTRSLRMEISFFGSILLSLLFFTMSLWHTVHHHCKYQIEDLTYIAYNTVIAGCIFLLIFARFLTLSFEPERLTIYLWSFLLIVTAHTIVRNRRKKILSTLFFLFMILQIYIIPPFLYDRLSLPEYNFGRRRDYFLPQEYSATFWFNSSGKVIGDNTVLELLGGLKQINVYQIRHIFEGNFTDIENYDWFFYRREDANFVPISFHVIREQEEASKILRVSNETYVYFSEFHRLDRVFDNIEVIIYKIYKHI